jgi:hypothetical protein
MTKGKNPSPKQEQRSFDSFRLRVLSPSCSYQFSANLGYHGRLITSLLNRGYCGIGRFNAQSLRSVPRPAETKQPRPSAQDDYGGNQGQHVDGQSSYYPRRSWSSNLQQLT